MKSARIGQFPINFGPVVPNFAEQFTPSLLLFLRKVISYFFDVTFCKRCFGRKQLIPHGERSGPLGKRTTFHLYFNGPMIPCISQCLRENIRKFVISVLDVRWPFPFSRSDHLFPDCRNLNALQRSRVRTENEKHKNWLKSAITVCNEAK